MKFSIFVLLSVLSSVSAGKPSLTIKVSDGSFDNLDGLEPTISWETSGESEGTGFSAGVEMGAAATTDVGSLAKSIWGKASRDVGGWGVSARAELEGSNLSSADIEIDATNEEADISVHLEGTACTEAVKTDDARITVNPRYDVGSKDGDVVLSYSKDDISIEITASKDNQSITISQQVDEENKISPTIASSGDSSVEWERSFGDDNSVTTTLKPNDSVNVEWSDGAWTANVNVPIDGSVITGTNVGIKRDVAF
eukprot:CAMPEP_0194392762 /NCGR_PEP_ID=MMETSP0174-20130528/122919_1 /TAXON_ID=216777 /ORGANISM="Proboscia alata, Strain PI-D3" /LENGTH=253 /DNA_ID=CAMNT_0039188369 /DNA_START=55 /DNA_END=816 /DNA_ORIENTATION=-